MRRIKSVDVFRGWAIYCMITFHTSLWWASPLQSWPLIFFRASSEIVGAASFLMVSGISAALFIRIRMEKAHSDPNYSKHVFVKEYYFRALLIFILALIYNAATVIYLTGITGLWSWYILFIIGICLFITFPLMRLSKITRLILAIIIILITYPILDYLSILRQTNFLGEIIYHLIFNPTHEYPFLPHFSIYCLGTVVGDLFYEIYSIKGDIVRNKNIKRKIIYPFTIIGTIMVVSSILSNIFIFQYDISTWTVTDTFGKVFIAERYLLMLMLWAIGWCFVILGLLTYYHEYKSRPEWKYRFLYYFSYYSLTLYFLHNLAALIFWDSIDAYIVWIPVIGAVIVFWYISKLLHEKVGPKASLKWWITRASVRLSNRNKDKNI